MDRNIDELIDPGELARETEVLVRRYLLGNPSDDDLEDQYPNIVACAQVRVARRAFEAARADMSPAEQAEVARLVFEASVIVAARGVVSRERPRMLAALVRLGHSDPEAAADEACAKRYEVVRQMLLSVGEARH